MNNAVLIGFVNKPEHRITSGGISVISFNLSVPRDYKGDDGKKIYDSFKIVAWRGLADYCHKYLDDGSKVCVSGPIQNRSYERDGQKHWVTEIVASKVDNLTPLPDKQTSVEDAEDDSDFPF